MNLRYRHQSQYRNAIVDERMYLDHFELREAPFSITPDPRFVYLTAQHRDALAHLLFGINQGGGGGFVQLTGEVGTGKTTLCRLLMAQVPENVRIALVLNPMQQPIELLRTICDELRILLPKRTSSIKVLTDALTRYLLESYASGLRVVLIIDEAQNLSFDALEQVRLLTNLETPTQKLLQIILLGQPECCRARNCGNWHSASRPAFIWRRSRPTTRPHTSNIDWPSPVASARCSPPTRCENCTDVRKVFRARSMSWQTGHCSVVTPARWNRSKRTWFERPRTKLQGQPWRRRDIGGTLA